MESKGYIDETIESLEKSAVEVKRTWGLFKSGEIDKKQFEKNYRHVLNDWLSELKSEACEPNNGDKYKNTNPECKYFHDMDV